MRQQLSTIAAVLALACAAAAVVIGTVALTQDPTAADYMAEIIELERKELSGGGNRDITVALMANVYVDHVDAAGRTAAKLGLDSCADTTSWRGPYTDS